MIDCTYITFASAALVKCRCCGKVEKVSLSDSEVTEICSKDSCLENIEQILPGRSPAARRLFAENLCYHCQRKKYGTPGIIEETFLHIKNTRDGIFKELAEKRIA